MYYYGTCWFTRNWQLDIGFYGYVGLSIHLSQNKEHSFFTVELSAHYSRLTVLHMYIQVSKLLVLGVGSQNGWTFKK